MTLALLLTAVTGAWADGVTMKEITGSDIQSSWNGNTDPVKATDLPGFKAMTHDEAIALGAPSNNELVYLIYAINAGNKFAALIYEYGTKSSYEAEFNLDDLKSTAENYWVYYTYSDAPASPEVTLNADNTEASFEMPTSDVTADYELVRDMSIQMTAIMGDGTNGVRYRVKKDGNKFIPADMEMAAVPALFTVNDAIEQKALTQTQDYIVQIYAIDAEGQPTGEAMTFATFTFEPGIYAVKAVAADGSDYDGETDLSNTFQLFQGYEITVPAGEFATFYKDEPLRIEDQEAELYTISSVNDTQAVLSQKCDAMPSNTPMLVYNNSDETKVILLIPCNEPDLALTVAPEFQGTLTGTTIAASTDAQTNYALNGKQFVFVKDAIEIGANKAWLSIPSGMIAGARALTIVFSDATGVNGVIGVKEVNDGSWYDLNGRKLNGMPTKKGVYIMNGRKVVVK